MRVHWQKLGGIMVILTALFVAGPVFASGPQDLQVSCAGTPAQVNIGESVTWSANVSGGSAPYDYNWSGTDSLDGTTSIVTKTYTTAGTKNATLTVADNEGNVITKNCSVEIETPPSPPTPPSGCTSNCGGGGGGGLNQPTVVLLQKAVKAPLAFVYLSQIPYTGLSGTGKILLLILGIAIWSALVVYALRNRKVLDLAQQLTSRLRAFISPTPNVIFKAAEQTMDNLEISDDLLLDARPLAPTPPPTSEIESLLAMEAKKERTLISPDGLKVVLEAATAKGEEPLATLGKAIENAKTKFPREDGWLLLNKEKIDASLSPMNITIPTYGMSDKFTPDMPKTPTVTDQMTEVNTFVSLLSRGDEKAVANHLRALRESGKSVERFIRETIMELDSAYRARLESDNNRRNFVLSQIISRWSGEKTEEVIGILLSIIDKNYKNPAIGLKLAVMRIAELKE